MNNFSGTNQNMQRRAAVTKGRVGDPGQGPANMANSFAGNSNMAMNRGGNQPRIGVNEDFLSESNNFDDRPFGVNKQFSGFQQQQRPASNQGSYNDMNPYGSAGGGGGNRPSTGSFPGGGAGGTNNRFQNPNATMSRTQGNGFGMNNNNNRASNISAARGSGGGYSQPFQQDPGLNRHGSQQSIGYSQNSYGDQQNARGGGGGGGNYSQFGRTSNPGGAFRGGNTLMRQGSIGGGGFGGGGQRSFGNTFQSRQNNNSGLGNYNNDKLAQINNMCQQNPDFANLLNYMGQHVNQTKRNRGYRSPNEFFKDFDSYRGRSFEEWELEVMFQLQPGEARPLMDQFGNMDSQTIPIGDIIQCLMVSVDGLSIDEVNRQPKSAWDEKRKRLPPSDYQLFRDFAEMIKEKYGGYSQIYLDAFANIQEENMQEPYLSADKLKNAIFEHINQNVQEKSLYDFLNFMVIGRDYQQIHMIQFVQSLQVLSPDSAFKAASPDALGGGSIDQFTGQVGMEPVSLAEMLLKIPEGRPVNQHLQKLGKHLEKTGEIGKLDESFPSATKMQIKMSNGSLREVNCAKKNELETFLRNQVDKSIPLFPSGQIGAILENYKAEVPRAQVAAPAPAPAPAQAPSPGPQQRMEAISEAPEHAASARAAAIQEESKQVTPRKEDSEFERDDEYNSGLANQQSASEILAPPPKEGAAIDTSAKPADKPIERSAEKPPPAQQPVIKPVEKPEEEKKAPIDSSKNVAKPAEKTAEKPAEKLAEKPAEKPAAETKPTAAVEEQKEGGEPEYYEGGADEEWINLDKFKADLKDAMTLTRDVAKDIILKVFERIKKWQTQTMKSIKLLFRQQDKKRKKTVNKKQLYTVLTKVYQTAKISLNQQIMAILTVIGDVQNETLFYERFSRAYFDYANEKMLQDFDPLQPVINNLREFTAGKSLVSLLITVDQSKVLDENYRFEVKFKTMIQKISRHHGRSFTIDNNSQDQLRKRVVTPSNQVSDMADLIMIQELMGFEEQDLLEVQGNAYRRISMELQTNLKTIEMIREVTVGRARGRAMVQQDQMENNWFSNGLTACNGDNDLNQFRALMQEHSEGQANMVNSDKFLGKIEREMTKFNMIQRFYLLLKKTIEGKAKRVGQHHEIHDFEEVAPYLAEKGYDTDANQIEVKAFKELLKEMDLIGADDENWDYFAEDFDPEEEGIIASERFDEDMKEIIPHMDFLIGTIFNYMDQFCKDEYSKRSLKEEFVNIQRNNQVQLLSARDSSKKQQIMWLHSFDFQRWFQTAVMPFVSNDQYGARYDREVVNLFTLYMSQSVTDKNMIYIPHLLQKYVEQFPDPRVEQEMAEESLILLIRYVCRVLDEQNQVPDNYFQNKTVSQGEFAQILKGEPFCADIRCELPTKLESVIRYSRELLTRNFVDLMTWKDKLLVHIDKLVVRQRELLNIRKALDEMGQTIEQALMTIKCTNDNIEDLGIELSDMAQLCHMTEIKLDIKMVLEPILDTFDRNLYGEVAATDLIKCINTAHFGIFEDGAQHVGEDAIVSAKRYFQTVDQVILAMCNDIDDRQMTDFGSFLKGNDLFNEGKIRNDCLFQILNNIFSELVGEGDILDLIKMFDPQGEGVILIKDVQRVFNSKIQYRRHQIRLVSWVDTCVGEAIVDPVSPRSKGAKGALESADIPKHYSKIMLLDIHCGSMNKSEGVLYNWFLTDCHYREGELNKNEFSIALERLGVESEIKDKEDVFAYMLKKVATRDDKLIEFHKMPISNQSLKVDDLCDILNKDMPGVDPITLQEKALKMTAMALTEAKVPVLDGLKKHEVEDMPGLIDSHTFAVNVLENEYKLKGKLTRNVINCLVSKYEDAREVHIRYDAFIRDLENYEATNHASIRIFKTQKEINFFNQTQKMGGDENVDAESYRQNRILVEPIKEPVYDSVTSKNTYYMPPLDDHSGYDSAHNSFINEGTGNVSYHGGQQQHNTQPKLDPALHSYVDDVIVLTRRLGVSVEGYFQRFGKFSTQDGIRKIDLKQFTDAISNLSDSNWATQKPLLVKELFDSIQLAFENFNNRFTMNQTIMSGPSMDINQPGLEPRLTLDQIGKIVYHNSSVNLETIEADTLTELHKVLFENGLIDKLQDMVTFMNWERDSSCTIDQFKSLLLESMKVESHIGVDKLELLLQRYRQDSYEQAKIQRNELAELNSDRLEVIKKGFRNVGKQRIQILGCYQDLGYQQRKIGLKDQWASRIAETIIKAYQVKLLEEKNLPMTGTDVDSQMHQFCLRMCNSSQEQFTYSDFQYMLTALQLWDGQVYSRGKLETFFKICQREELAEPHFFAPNKMDVSQLVIPQYIPMQQYVKAFEFLGRKPLSFIYQEVMDKFYIISKRQHISISGPTIMHMFDYDDLEESGFVQIELFVQRIVDLLGRKHFKGNAIVTDHIHENDLRFLATKYMQRDSDGLVQYSGFLEDYDAIEKLGLGAGTNQLSLNSQSLKRDTALKSLTGGNTWRVKTIAELTPLESKQLYEKMGSYIEKKDLVSTFCLNLVNTDQMRDGFLSRRDIQGLFNRLGIKMSSKQTTQLVQVLIMDHSENYSYLEMIALLCGESVMHSVMHDNHLSFGQTIDKPKKIDMSLLEISESFKDQLELKLALVQGYVSQLSRGSSCIRDQELFKILKDAEIVPEMKDINVLEEYLAFQRNKENNTINFRILLEHFRIQSETSELLSEIVNQLLEKKIVLEEKTTKRRFSFDEFRELLDRIGVKISNSRTQVLQQLFFQMSDRQEDVMRSVLVKCFSSKFTSIGKPVSQTRLSKRNLPEPPYTVNAFLIYLVNNKHNLRVIFADYVQSKRIPVDKFNYFLEHNGYHASRGDLDVIIKFFAPPGGHNSARSGGQQNQQQQQSRRNTNLLPNSARSEAPDTLDLGKIIVYARRIDPNYCMDVAEGPGGSVKRHGASKTVLTSFPQRIKTVLKRISDYMIDNQIPKEILFQELDRNNDGKVTQDELVLFATTNKMIEGLQQDDVRKLFSFLDSNQNGSISINELCMLVDGVTLSMQARMASFSLEFEAQLKCEIEELFDRLDTDHSRALTANELVQLVRPTDSSGSVTLEKAYDIIRQLDANGDGNISKPEFVNYLLPKQKRQILDFEGQMEDLRKLFKEQIAQGVASSPEDASFDLLNKNQFIAKDGLRNLIIKAGHKKVTQEEIDSIFQEMDSDQNGLLDIDEFMAFVQVADRVKTKNQPARDAVFNIRKARLKLNSLDMLELFMGMPLSFLPSFSMKELENRKSHLPIHGIQFNYDHKTMSYAGLDQIKDLRAKQDQPKLYIAQYKPKLGLEIGLSSEAVSVPLIQRLREKTELPHCEVRCFLFDMAQKVYLSNFYILGAEAQRKVPAKKQQVMEPQASANWRFDKNLQTFFLTSNQAENVNAHLVIEFVIYGKNVHELSDKSNQVTVAWTNVPLVKLQSTVKHKLDLKGGNPFKEQALVTAEDTEQQQQAGSKSLFKKIFGGSSDKGKVARYVTLEAKPFIKLPEQTQFELSSLHSNTSCLVCKPLLSLAVTFRNHCYLLLTKHEQEMTQPQLDLVMVQFPKIYNSPDFLSAIADCWPTAINLAGNVFSDERHNQLDFFVRMVFALMFEPGVKLDQIYPTRSSPLNQHLYRSRQISLKSTLMKQNKNFMNKVRAEVLVDKTLKMDEGDATIEPQDGDTLFMEEYVPFTMGEICGNYDGYDGEDAISGLIVDKEKTVNEMERKYAADGLYI